MTETFRRLDNVRVIDPADDHYGERGCIGAIDHNFAPGRPYCVNFESTSRWYGADEIVGEFALDEVRASLEQASDMLDSLVGRDAVSIVDVVHAMDQLRFTLKGLVNEVGKLEKRADGGAR
jgi:hypothetical protein